MTGSVFDPTFEQLPTVVPIFPLSGALLLPRGRLPLNIFEPRYLAMTRDALMTEWRLIGMIQPTDPADEGGEQIDVYGTGCAGRIISFQETPDGRYLMTLAGMCRFDVVEELPLKDGYRRVVANFGPYAADMAPSPEAVVDRESLLEVLRDYLDHKGISADWDSIESTPDEQLVIALAMMCPFAPSEKQALLQAPDLAERSSMMITLLEMALREDGGSTAGH